MKKIRYKKGDMEFITELRSEVNKYFENKGIENHGGSKILFKTFLMFLVYMVPFGLLLSGVVNNLLPVLACWVIMGLGTSGIGLVTMHDANHGSFSNRHWVNKLFSNSLYLLGGFPANWRYQHNTLHHGYTNIEGHDEDIAHEGIVRFSPHKPLRKVHKFQHIYAWLLYGLMTFSWVTMKDFKRLKKYENEGAVLSSNETYRQLFFKLLITKILYYTVFLAIPIAVIPLAWYWTVLGFFIMHFTSGLVLSTIFQTAHVVPTSDYPLPDKNNELNNNWAIHQLHTTCDFAPKSNVLSWLVGGLNFQVVHHLFPNISHIHYKDISKIVQQTATKHQLPYHVNKTFAGAIYQHLLMLKTLGKPENRFDAEVMHLRNKKIATV
jgi:linoleoyl-CoA desaturase